MASVRRFAGANRQLLLKTASYYAMHITVAALVAYAVTGSLATAVALSLLEPTVQAVAFFFHERAWSARPRATAAPADLSAPPLSTLSLFSACSAAAPGGERGMQPC